MKCYEFKGLRPQIHENAYVSDGVHIIGDVKIEDKASIWYNCTLRGDLASIHIGEGANVQELSVVHNDAQYPVSIGKYTTIGHKCVIHGAKVGDNCMIGMGAILLNGVEIPDNCLVGAGSLVTNSEGFEEGMLIVGSPAKPVRKLSLDNQKYIIDNGIRYAKLAKEYKNNVKLIEV